MITQKAKDAALDLQTAFAAMDGERIQNNVFKLIHELGGSPATVLGKSAPIQVMYLCSLIVRHMPSFALDLGAPSAPLAANDSKPAAPADGLAGEDTSP